MMLSQSADDMIGMVLFWEMEALFLLDVSSVCIDNRSSCVSRCQLLLYVWRLELQEKLGGYDVYYNTCILFKDSL